MEPIYYVIQIHVILHLDTAINVSNDLTNSMEPFISDSIFVVCYTIFYIFLLYYKSPNHKYPLSTCLSVEVVFRQQLYDQN